MVKLSYYERNKERILQRMKEDRDKNPEKYKKYRDTYKQTESYKIKHREQNKKWKKNNPQYNINKKCHEKLKKIIFDFKDRNRYVELIGCTPKEFVDYIEDRFVEGMSWDNYGYDVWHLDHIKPCRDFDLTNIKERNKCFCYKNTNPLMKSENFLKG